MPALHSVSFSLKGLSHNLCFSNIVKYLILETFAQLIAKFRNTACFRMLTQSSSTCQEQADQPQLFSWKLGETLAVHIMTLFQPKTVTTLH